MSESRREKIAAVVVTYNRKRLLGECLDSLLRQTHPLDGLWIIDNHSTDGTHEYLRSRGMAGPLGQESGEPLETVRPVPRPGSSDGLIEVHYVRMPANTGGAGGFHEGLQRAVEAGFDWLWLMDDDLATAPDALAVLVEKKEALEHVAKESFLLNSLVLDRDQADGEGLAFPLQELAAGGGPRIGVYHWRLSEVRDQVSDGLYRWACPFNGTFVPARITTEIGLPDKDFFIWGDEKDFLWRAARRFRLYTVVDSKVYHPRARRAAFDWKQYYNIRNMIVVNRHFRLHTLRNLKVILLGIARGACHGRWGASLAVRAVRDGLAGRLGKREDLHP